MRTPRPDPARLAEQRPGPLAKPVGSACTATCAWSSTTGCARCAATGSRGWKRWCCAATTPAVLVAHSLGCILVAAWAAHSRNTHRVKGGAAGGAARRGARGPAPAAAELVADPAQAPAFPERAGGQPDDPYCAFERARELARPVALRSSWTSARAATSTPTPAWATGPKAMCSCKTLTQGSLIMVTKKPKGLGRGLEALLGPTVQEPRAE